MSYPAFYVWNLIRPLDECFRAMNYAHSARLGHGNI